MNINPNPGMYIKESQVELTTPYNFTIFFSINNSEFMEYTLPITLEQVKNAPKFNYTIITFSDKEGYIPSNNTIGSFIIQTQLEPPVCTPTGDSFYNDTVVQCSCKTNEEVIVSWTSRPPSILFSSTALKEFLLYPMDSSVEYNMNAYCRRNEYANSIQVLDSFLILPYRVPNPPNLNPSEGQFLESVNVILSCDDPQCSILYTIDGSDPRNSSTSQYYSQTHPITFHPGYNHLNTVSISGEETYEGFSELISAACK